MKYKKTALTFEKQADILIKRGLLATREDLTNKLSVVNYYRLSAYWHPFREKDSEKLRPGTSLETVWQRYVFDRQLRLIAIDAIERIEIAIRTQAVNLFTIKYDAFGHLKYHNLPNLSQQQHCKFINNIGKEKLRSREDFVQHFKNKYTHQKHLPLWMACELMTFGGLLTLYRGLDDDLQNAVARSYGIPAKVLLSWLTSINYIRNICAHHARLWNRRLVVKPMIPKQNKYPQWHKPIEINKDKVLSSFTIFYFLLQQIAPQSQWKNRLIDLFNKYEDVPKEFMGFPPNWQNSPIWQD